MAKNVPKSKEEYTHIDPKLKAHIAVDDGKEYDALVGQVMESGDSSFPSQQIPIMYQSPKRKIFSPQSKG